VTIIVYLEIGDVVNLLPTWAAEVSTFNNKQFPAIETSRKNQRQPRNSTKKKQK